MKELDLVNSLCFTRPCHKDAWLQPHITVLEIKKKRGVREVQPLILWVHLQIWHVLLEKITIELHKASHSFHIGGRSAPQEKRYICLVSRIVTGAPSDRERASLLNGQSGRESMTHLCSTHQVGSALTHPQEHSYFLTIESFLLRGHFFLK